MGEPALATQWFGTFLVEDGKVVDQRLFPAEPQAIADRLAAIQRGEVVEEERALAASRDAVVVPGRRLLSLSNASTGRVPRIVATPGEHGFSDELLHQATLVLARATIKEGLADRTRHLMQAISALDEAHEVENLMGERLVAWATLHAPEVVDQCDDHAALAKAIVEHEDMASLLAAFEVTDTLGAPTATLELDAIKGLARSVLEQVELRKPTEGFVDEVTRAMAPNLTKLLGSTIAARLIYQAGGLLDLAKLPSSTVQTLGAEKALFRHFTEGAPPPKHGVIFQHPLIHRSHPNDRGKISRAMAGKAAIAARMDAFGEKDRGAELKAELEERAKTIKRIGRRRAMAKRKRGGGR